jgi:hypothetical protein
MARRIVFIEGFYGSLRRRSHAGSEQSETVRKYSERVEALSGRERIKWRV